MNPQQLQNLKELRALGARILAEPERYPLDFNLFHCGTTACLSGWYGIEAGLPSDYAYEFHERLFGIEPGEALRLFRTTSDEPYTALAQRLDYLDTLIAQHEPQPKGIPSSVRAIFDVETA